MASKSNLIEFQTERLLVHTISSSNAEALAQFYKENRNHFAPWEPTFTADLSLLENASKDIGTWLKEYDRGTAIRFLVFLKGEEKNLIGVVNFSQIFHGSFQACYLGFKVDHRYEGRGMMLEAIKASLEYMFIQERLYGAVEKVHFPIFFVLSGKTGDFLNLLCLGIYRFKKSPVFLEN